LSLDQSNLTDSEKKKVRKNLREAQMDVKQAERSAKIVQQMADSARAELIQADKARSTKYKKKRISDAEKEISRAQRHVSDAKTSLSEASQKTVISETVVAERLGGIPQYINVSTKPKGGSVFDTKLIRCKRVGGMYDSRPEVRAYMKKIGLRLGTRKGQGVVHKIRSGKHSGKYLVYVREEE
jgi:hypothetical protein